MPRSEYRSDYSPPRRGGLRTTEYEEIDIRERRTPRERDYLRDAYERVDDRNGTMVIRDDERSVRGGRRDTVYREEEEVIIAKSKRKDRDRPRRRDIDEEEDVRIRESSRDTSVRRRSFEDDVRIRRRDRPVEREEFREESAYRPRRERYDREEIKEEWIYVPRERPSVAVETEEWRYGPRRRPRREDVESVTIRDRERERPRESSREEVIDIRERDRDSRVYREEEIDIRERQRPRDYREEEIRIRERERDRSARLVELVRESPKTEDIDIRIRERERDRPMRKEEIRIRESPRTEEVDIRERDRPADFRDEEIKITERDRGGYRDEEIRIRERDSRDQPRENGSDASRRDRRDERKEDELIITRDEHDGPSGRTDEIIIRRKERSPSPARAPTPPPPEPEPIIRAPPIHQEIITHHRHIDHGYEAYRPPVSAPPRLRTPSPSPSPPKSSYEEIAIRHRDRDGKHEDDIVIKHRDSRDDARPNVNRRRSISVDGRSTVSRRPAPPQIDNEADYYARKTAERAVIGEAYHGATKDWAIVDVPPGTNRVQMDGVGGASEEITWQRYNGVRRSKFIPETDRGPDRDQEMVRRKYVGSRPKTDTMWTEITKDLVVTEALDGFGYEYEETEWFFYVMEYLRYEDVRRLVQVSDDIRSRRRERVKQIEWETQMPRERRSPRPSLPPPPSRIVEKEKIVVIRNER